jgi:hypothetical protein
MIYLLAAVGFPPGGSGPYTVFKYKRNSCIHEEKKYTKQYQKRRTQNGKQNVENNKTNTKQIIKTNRAIQT